MSDLSLYIKISMLPSKLKSELVAYVDSLLHKTKKDKDNNKKKHPKAGCMKGTFEMKPDFDAPINDFKEYM